MSPEELAALLDAHDALVSRCAHGALSVPDFLAAYDNFPHAYALDGHEAASTTEDRTLEAASDRIRFHLAVFDTFSGLCSNADLERDATYRAAGRFDEVEAAERLRDLVRTYPGMRIARGRDV